MAQKQNGVVFFGLFTHIYRPFRPCNDKKTK